MGIFDDIKAKGAAYRLTEEALYAEALREIETGQRRDGIWAMAMAASEMDSGKAGAKYIKLRVQSLKDEVTVYIAGINKTEAITRRVAVKPNVVTEPRNLKKAVKGNWDYTKVVDAVLLILTGSILMYVFVSYFDSDTFTRLTGIVIGLCLFVWGLVRLDLKAQ